MRVVGIAALGLLKIALVTFVLSVVIFFIAWWPVIDQIIHWCERYPQSLADCREQ